MEQQRISYDIFTCYYTLVLYMRHFGGRLVIRQLQLTHRLIQQVVFNCEISLNAKIFLLLGNR